MRVFLFDFLDKLIKIILYFACLKLIKLMVKIMKTQLSYVCTQKRVKQ